MATKLTQLSLVEAQELETARSLYVINRTSVGDHNMKGEILFELTGKDGRSRSVKVPATWIPFNIAAQYKREEIVEHPDFARMVLQGSLVIVDSKEAEEYLKNDKMAASEQQRVFLSLNRMSIDPQAGKDKATITMQPNAPGMTAAAGILDADTDGVAPVIVDIMTRDEKEMNSEQRLSALMNVSRLTQKDANYIAGRTQDDAILRYVQNADLAPSPAPKAG